MNFSPAKLAAAAANVRRAAAARRPRPWQQQHAAAATFAVARNDGGCRRRRRRRHSLPSALRSTAYSVTTTPSAAVVIPSRLRPRNASGAPVLQLTRPFSSSDGDGSDSDSRRQQLYLHIAPDGDHWTSPELFAAKHLQPDYVRSIPVPDDFDPEEAFFGEDDSDGDGSDGEEAIRRAYDEGKLPEEVLRRFQDDDDGEHTEKEH